MIAKLYKLLPVAFRNRIEGRSSQWPVIEKQYLEKHPTCAGCGTTKHLQVHHKKPFHLFPQFELDINNLISLCEDSWLCHLHLGHSGDWRAYNPNVEEDTAKQLSRIKSRLYN